MSQEDRNVTVKVRDAATDEEVPGFDIEFELRCRNNQRPQLIIALDPAAGHKYPAIFVVPKDPEWQAHYGVLPIFFKDDMSESEINDKLAWLMNLMPYLKVHHKLKDLRDKYWSVANAPSALGSSCLIQVQVPEKKRSKK